LRAILIAKAKAGVEVRQHRSDKHGPTCSDKIPLADGEAWIVSWAAPSRSPDLGIGGIKDFAAVLKPPRGDILI